MKPRQEHKGQSKVKACDGQVDTLSGVESVNGAPKDCECMCVSLEKPQNDSFCKNSSFSSNRPSPRLICHEIIRSHLAQAPLAQAVSA